MPNTIYDQVLYLEKLNLKEQNGIGKLKFVKLRLK
jgi:hypothetical protein